MVFYLEKVNKEKNLWCYGIYISIGLLILYFIFNLLSLNNSSQDSIIYTHSNNYINNDNYIKKEDNKQINIKKEDNKQKKILNNINLYNQEVYNKYSKF